MPSFPTFQIPDRRFSQLFGGQFDHTEILQEDLSLVVVQSIVGIIGSDFFGFKL